MRRAAAASALLAAALLATAASARVMIPERLRPPEKYVEIVRERKGNCTVDCFLEFLVLSSGVILRKHVDTPSHDDGMSFFAIRAATPEAAAAVLDHAAKIVSTETDTQRGKITDPHNVYYYDGDKHADWSDVTETADFTALVAAAEDAFSKGALAENFYLHEYWQPAKGLTMSLHVFADGTMITSSFDERSYHMVDTGLSRLDVATMEELKTLAAKAQAEKPEKYTGCPAATGLQYALVEFANGGNIQKSYTCGGAGPVGDLFNRLRAIAPP